MAIKNNSKSNLLDTDISIGGASLTQRALFAKHLAIMLKSGLDIIKALKIASDSSKGKLKKAINSVISSVDSGQSLSSAFSRYPSIFGDLFVSSVYAGENSGILDQSLENIAIQLEKEKNLRAKIKGAMLYPIVVLIAAFILGLVVSFFILPKITPLFEGMRMDLPFSTRILISFSHFISDHSWGLFIGIFGSLFLLIVILKQKFSHIFSHFLLLHLPIIKSIVHSSNLAKFNLTLSTLLHSGLNIDEAIKISAKSVSNYYYNRALTKASLLVAQGSMLSDNLADYPNLFPVMAVEMIRVGEQSGKLEESLLYLSSYYETEADNAAKTFSTAIEPILLIFIGLVVAFLSLSIITPIYNITGGIKH